MQVIYRMQMRHTHLARIRDLSCRTVHAPLGRIESAPYREYKSLRRPLCWKSSRITKTACCTRQRGTRPEPPVGIPIINKATPASQSDAQAAQSAVAGQLHRLNATQPLCVCHLHERRKVASGSQEQLSLRGHQRVNTRYARSIRRNDR